MTKNSTHDYLKDDRKLLVKPGSKVSLKDYDTSYTAGYKDKEDAAEKLAQDVKRLTELQDLLYASSSYSLLMIFQAMDAAGKDGTIKHVMSGVNPQGCEVYSFKAPSAEELAHDFLWRHAKAVPPRGKIGIFNRSHYEEVLVTRVHPEFILKQNIPAIDSMDKIDKNFWKARFEQINSFEKSLCENGTVILKFFLNISKMEQKDRFLKRINEPEKQWKFSLGDVKEREHWGKYMGAFEEALSHTSTEHAPWYIIPADRKWFMRMAVGDIIVGTLEGLGLEYPKMTEQEKQGLQTAKQMLLDEK